MSVVLPELPKPVGEVLHQLAAAADADREAPQAAAGAEEQQGGQEEARREHGVVSEVVRGSAGFLLEGCTNACLFWVPMLLIYSEASRDRGRD